MVPPPRAPPPQYELTYQVEPAPKHVAQLEPVSITPEETPFVEVSDLTRATRVSGEEAGPSNGDGNQTGTGVASLIGKREVACLDEGSDEGSPKRRRIEMAPSSGVLWYVLLKKLA